MMNHKVKSPLSQKDKFGKLPSDIQEAMFSVDSAKIMKDIADKNDLHIDQAGALVDETGKLMMGETTPSNFVGSVEKHVRVDANTARSIAEEVNKRIFKPIRESLKEMYHIGNGSGDNTQPAKKSEESSEESGEEKDHSEEGKVKTTKDTQSMASSDPYRETIEEDDV